MRITDQTHITNQNIEFSCNGRDYSWTGDFIHYKHFWNKEYEESEAEIVMTTSFFEWDNEVEGEIELTDYLEEELIYAILEQFSSL